MQWLFGWITSLLRYIAAPITTKVVVPNAPDKLVALIKANNYHLGPNGNNGEIFENAPGVNEQIAALLRINFDRDTIPLAAAWLHGESLFSVRARNPNKTIGPRDPDTAESFMHTDYGIAQFDGATMAGGDAFWADVAHLPFAEIVAKAYDPAWAIPRFAKFVAMLKDRTNVEIACDPSMLPRVPGGDMRVLTVQAYNAGLHGAALLDKMHGTGGDWSYALGIIKNADAWKTILNA